MTAISNRQPPVDIEYDCRGVRKRKHFEDAHKAKIIYSQKMKAGMNPKVFKPTKKKTKRKSNPMKPRSKKKMDAIKLSPKQLEVIKYLKSRKATSSTHAIDRKQVWEKCEVGLHVIAQLKKLELLRRADHEDGSKEYYLTKTGVAASMV